MIYTLIETEKIEILTLQDNYIEVTAMDSSAVVSRADVLREGRFRRSVLAEHGFAAVVKTVAAGRTRSLLFDFGFSEGGAAYNAEILGVQLGEVETAVLSHGHNDHTGGFDTMAELLGRRSIPFVVHPAVFRDHRYLKMPTGAKVFLSPLTREQVAAAGLRLVETREPLPLLGDTVLFLGEIPRETNFEKGFPIAHYEQDGRELWDPIEDDTSIVMNLRGKGLVILSGCAHAGIVNTVLYARKVTGVEKVHAVMGGYHLSGPLFEGIIGRTVEELEKIAPDYVIPCHCTGRKAIMEMEKAMPGRFILNMSGTRLTFTA